MNERENWITYLIIIFLATVLSSLGSLIFSEILKFPPCELCWYQRIFMFPIVLIAMVGIYLRSKDVAYYIFPFPVLGLCFSTYHNLVYYKFIEQITPCAQGISCSSQHINWFGFVSIPLLSFAGFLFVLILNFRILFLIKTRE